MAACVCASAVSAAAAPRVASLNMCTDEYALLLAEPEQIVSLTHLSHDAREFAWWRSARLYPSNDGSIASVATMRPDVILTMGGLGRDQQRLADAIGAELIDLPFPGSLADVEDGVRAVAARLGNPDRGRRVLRQMRSLAASAPENVEHGLYLAGGGQGISAGSLGDQWLALGGLAQPAGHSGRVAAEHLLRDPPDLVIRSRYRRGQTSRSAHWIGFRILDRLEVPEIQTDGRRWTCSGPALVPEIRRLRRRIAG